WTPANTCFYGTSRADFWRRREGSMTPRATVLLFFFACRAAGQTTILPDSNLSGQLPPQEQAKPIDTTQNVDTTQNKDQGEAQRSTLEVKPGPPVIKQKDLWEGTGYFHPFVRMPKYILQDQKAIWTSPFHTAKADVKYWAIFGVATAAFVTTDRWTVKHLPN